jgi:type IV secretory pathway VirB10-like protein
MGRSLNVQLTITVRSGFPVRVIINHDFVPYAG